jgi:hypothetical protein
MTDTKPAEAEIPEAPVVSNATRKAVDAYRRIKTLENELDAARTEWGDLVKQIPDGENTSYYYLTEAVREELHTARHAAPEPEETEHPEETHDGTE